MQTHKKPTLILLTILVMIASGCSTHKNTAGSRFYHAFTTRYNVYFNGKQAYLQGVKTVNEGNKDNHLDFIPFYPIGNKSTQGSASGDFDRAIEKAQKAVTLHSIKRRPKKKPGKRYSEKERRWFNQKEFNPFLHNAWMLMGKAQFQKGDFPEAAATFSYIARLYDTQPEIKDLALIELAKCYTELEWYYDAEDALQKANTDSLPQKLIPAYTEAYANYLLSTERWREGVPHLRSSIAKEKNKKQKARLYYLLGEVYQQLGDPAQAYQAYRKTIRLSPPYLLALNAHIRQSECFLPKKGETEKIKKMTNKLRRMAHAKKNESYLDQIYYAIGNIYLAAEDTTRAIQEYKNGVEKGTQNGVEKGILQLKLGDLCWAVGQYEDAQNAYSSAIGLLDKEHEKFDLIEHRSKILDELVPQANAVALEDSLQHLASLDSAELKIVIDTLIARVIQEEERAKEEALQAERDQMKEQANAENSAYKPNKDISRPTMPGSNNKDWYFYNPQLVNQGKADFEKKWGKRKLEDNWRRRNKTVVALDDFEKIDYDEEEGEEMLGEMATDSLSTADTDSIPADTAVTDPKNPQFYLDQIPFTEEEMEASNQKLSDAIFQVAMICKDGLEDFPLAEKSFKRLTTEFPDFEHLDEAYYNLYLMYGRMKQMADANRSKDTLIARYPESKFALILGNPDFTRDAVYGRHLEDSLYAQTYTDYLAGNYQTVNANAEISATKYPMGKHRPKFLFLDAVSHLQTGDQKSFLTTLKQLVENYPENEITDLAAHILKGVQDGRLLQQGGVSFGSIWSRRKGENANDSIAKNDSVPTFSTEEATPHLFILAYEAGKVNENRLLYEVARFNFSSFVVKDFELNFVTEEGIGRLEIRTFANLDEARYYQKLLYENPHMNECLSGLRAILISENNYDLLKKYYSFDEYDSFYRKDLLHLPENELFEEDSWEEEAPIDGSTLDEPLQNLPEDENTEETEEVNEEDDEIEGDYFIPSNAENDSEEDNNGFFIPATEKEESEGSYEGEYFVPETPVENIENGNNEGEYFVPETSINKSEGGEKENYFAPEVPTQGTKSENNEGEYFVPGSPTEQIEGEDKGNYFVPQEESLENGNQEGEYFIPTETTTDPTIEDNNNYFVPASDESSEMEGTTGNEFFVPEVKSEEPAEDNNGNYFVPQNTNEKTTEDEGVNLF